MTKTFQFKISLDVVEPEIWRTVCVSSDINLHKFHQVIQDAMGWWDYHLYSFFINKKIYELPSDETFDEIPENSKDVLLSELKLKEGSSFRYIYDFGDNWEHTILLEKIIPFNENQNLPLCIDGKRNCPPEDCGSYPGYHELCEAMKKPKSKEAKEYFNWLGSEYNPDYFNKYSTNREILKGFYRNISD